MDTFQKIAALDLQELGVPLDQLFVISILFLNLPLALLIKALPPSLRTLLSTLLGCLWLLLVIRDWSAYIWVSQIIAYIAINLTKKNRLWTSVVVGLCFLMPIHIYRAYFDYESWKIDCSVPLMITVTKIIYYGKSTIQTNFFNYFAYMNSFFTVLIGPTLSLETHLNFVNSKDLHSKRFILVFLKGLFFTLIAGALLPSFPTDYLSKAEFLQQFPFFIRLNIELVIGLIFRSKYYAGFLLSQATVNILGIDIYCGSQQFQLTVSPKDKTSHWNSSVQLWLKSCFYDTLIVSLGQTLSTLIVFLVSAVWHGVYISYYIGFFHWGLIIHLSKLVYKSRDLFNFLGRMAPFVAWYFGFLLLHYVGALVVHLTFQKSYYYLSSHHFYGTIVPVLGIILFSFTKKKKKQ